jgi:hypothetical protein
MVGRSASRIAPLMTGDPVKIDALYREMTDDPSWLPDDFSDNIPVRIGEATEPLNLELFGRKQGSLVTRQGEVVQHPYLLWAACTLDGWAETLRCPIETKHIGGREPIEVVTDRYAPQTQWIMECTGADLCALSLLISNNEHRVEFVERDADYVNTMIERATAFMLCVKLRRPPVVLPAVPAPIEHDALVDVDMTENEKWRYAAQNWTQVCGAAETAKNMEKALKALMPVEARKAFGWGAQITRNRAGNLSLRQEAR